MPAANKTKSAPVNDPAPEPIRSTPEFELVHDRRVMCGRCRHSLNQSRTVPGVFDSETGLTYHCGDCDATYAVCRTCGWYMADGQTCHSCHPDHLKGDAMLPVNFRESDLVRDPGGRPGHWLNKSTGQVVSMPIAWRPGGSAAAPEGKETEGEATEGEAPAADDPRVGQRCEILIGRYQGRRGQVSDVGNEADGDQFGLRVIVDDEGTEIPLDAFEQVRMLTPEEVAADEAALKAKQQSQ